MRRIRANTPVASLFLPLVLASFAATTSVLSTAFSMIAHAHQLLTRDTHTG